jgi:hypothetical protein
VHRQTRFSRSASVVAIDCGLSVCETKARGQPRRAVGIMKKLGKKSMTYKNNIVNGQNKVEKRLKTGFGCWRVWANDHNLIPIVFCCPLSHDFNKSDLILIKWKPTLLKLHNDFHANTARFIMVTKYATVDFVFTRKLQERIMVGTHVEFGGKWKREFCLTEI